VEVDNKATKRALQKAARILENPGWCKGTAQNNAGECCAVGAIVTAHSGRPYTWDDGFDVAYAIELVEFYLGIDIPLARWNDEQTSPAPVIAALRGAASTL
jgi:hypothetical protein